MARIKGHTEMDTIVKNLPQDCLKCHQADSSAGYLGDITHRDHYRNPSKNVFIILINSSGRSRANFKKVEA